MSDRPIGDSLDQRIRAVVVEIVQGSPPPASLAELLEPQIKGESDMLEKNPEKSSHKSGVLIAAAITVVVIVTGVFAMNRDSDDGGRVDISSVTSFTKPTGVPDTLFAAESWAALPTAANLRALLESIGGYEALSLVEFEGSYDLFTFDPADPNRMLGSKRDPYSDTGENQNDNMLYTLTGSELNTELFAPDLEHDSANFERDGSVVTWITAADQKPSPRKAIVHNSDGVVLNEANQFVFNGQWAADSGSLITVAPNSPAPTVTYGSLRIQSASGEVISLELDTVVWVNSPESGVLAAYAEDGSGARLWSSSDGSELSDHVLAGRPITRAVVSADGSRAMTTLVDGTVEVIDVSSGEVVSTFGTIDVGRVRDPLTLNVDGSSAITVEETGRVRIWHAESGESIVDVDTFAGPHRYLSEQNSTTRTSAADVQGRRVAILTFLDELTWTIIDTDVESWTASACEIAGRAMTPAEREASGLPEGPGVCG